MGAGHSRNREPLEALSGGMTVGKYASEVVKLIRSWVGIKEGSEDHEMILNIYNAQKPLPRGYQMTMSDPWCAAAATAVAVKLGYTDIIPCECSCGKLIQKAKEMGIWVEDESVTPCPGWFALYDWGDDGKGDCTGDPEHIGIVTEVVNGQILVAEGNYAGEDGIDGVGIRPIALNGRYLRGFIVPKYDAEVDVINISFRRLELGNEGEDVRSLQILLIGRGYSCGLYGANGVFGEETRDALIRFQTAAGLTADGIADRNTWAALLGSKEAL